MKRLQGMYAWMLELRRHRLHLIDLSCDDLYGMVIHFDNCWCSRRIFTVECVELGHNIVYCTYDTAGDDRLRLCRAARPNVTKSWGRNCSGGDSIRCLLTAGSKVVDEKFSLSLSIMNELGKSSLGGSDGSGLVGVMGMSSEKSEAQDDMLAGVVIPLDDFERTGVMGNIAKG